MAKTHIKYYIRRHFIRVCTDSLQGQIHCYIEILICDPLNHEKDYYILRPSKTIPVFRVTQPYLNLLVKPRNVFRFSGKNIILCIFKSKMPFKMHKIIFFSRKKKDKKKYVCLPILKFSDPLPETRLFFYLALLYQYVWEIHQNETDKWIIYLYISNSSNSLSSRF